MRHRGRESGNAALRPMEKRHHPLLIRGLRITRNFTSLLLAKQGAKVMIADYVPEGALKTVAMTFVIG